MRFRQAILIAAVAALAAPAAAAAATTTSTLNGTVGAELSISVASPAAMTFTHAAPATTSSLVTVTSTQASWTLSIVDAATSNAGHLFKVGSPATVLQNNLQWSADGATFYNLTGAPATVKTGSLVDTATVTFRQTLRPTENVVQGDVYNLVATYTVT
jgi:hypothetical protein